MDVIKSVGLGIVSPSIIKTFQQGGGELRDDVVNFYNGFKNIGFINTLSIFHRVITNQKHKLSVMRYTDQNSVLFDWTVDVVDSRSVESIIDEIKQRAEQTRGFGIVFITYNVLATRGFHGVVMLYDYNVKQWELFNSSMMFKVNILDRVLCKYFSCKTFHFHDSRKTCPIQLGYKSCGLWSFAWPYIRMKFDKDTPETIYEFIFNSSAKQKHDLVFEFINALKSDNHDIKHEKIGTFKKKSRFSSIDDRIDNNTDRAGIPFKYENDIPWGNFLPEPTLTEMVRDFITRKYDNVFSVGSYDHKTNSAGSFVSFI